MIQFSDTLAHIKIKKLLITFFILLITQPINAAWYESTGTANVYQGHTDKARQQAIKEAVKDALLFAGAKVSSAQQVTNGLLTQDMFEVRASGVVNEIAIIDEKIESGKMYITLRADIFADERQCYATDYKKSLALTQFTLQKQEHAKIGELYELPKLTSQKLYKAIVNDADNLDPRNLFSHKINLPEDQTQADINSNRKHLNEIARQTDAQYILTGQLDDISLGKKPDSISSLWSNEQLRYFDLSMTLYDGYSGEMVHQLRYSSEALWDFDLRRQVDVNSRRFWQSNYGLAINAQLEKSISELDSYMRCLPSQAKIIDASANKVRFNLGKNNGVKVGDKLKIMHQASFKDKNGKLRPHFIISPDTIEVTQVYRQSAIAQSSNEAYLGNVQVGDLVRQGAY